jgi:hypothetical protein
VSPELPKDIEQNIHDLELAIKALLAVNSLEVPALRLRLDELLRIEESRWYFHTVVKMVSDQANQLI